MKNHYAKLANKRIINYLRSFEIVQNFSSHSEQGDHYLIGVGREEQDAKHPFSQPAPILRAY